jgi:hypothetical protein
MMKLNSFVVTEFSKPYLHDRIAWMMDFMLYFRRPIAPHNTLSLQGTITSIDFRIRVSGDLHCHTGWAPRLKTISLGGSAGRLLWEHPEGRYHGSHKTKKNASWEVQEFHNAVKSEFLSILRVWLSPLFGKHSFDAFIMDWSHLTETEDLEIEAHWPEEEAC